MKRLIIFLTLCLPLWCSCGGGNRTAEKLRDVETYIGDRPDSAYEVLCSIDPDRLSRRLRARCLLLKSIALDKNYVDLTDDSLITPAVRWYERHGNADDKLKAYYYQGRIYQNAGDDEAAMESFVKAEQNVGKAEDREMVGLLYLAMANTSVNVFDLEKFAEYTGEAESCFKETGDTNRYAYTLLNKATCFSISGELDAVSSVLDTVRTLWSGMEDDNRSAYYQMQLSLLCETGQYEELSEKLQEYMSAFPPEDVSWLSISEYCLAAGKVDDAASALERHDHYGMDRNQVYYLQKSAVYESLGQSEKALESYKKYVAMSDSLDMEIFSQDTKFIQDKYEKDLRIAETENARTFATLIAITVILASTWAVHFMRQALKKKKEENREMAKRNKVLSDEKTALEAEIEKYRENFSRLENERKELMETLEANPPIDNQCMKVLNDRLDLLNKFFAAAISGNWETDRKAGKELEQLVADRDQFLHTTRMAFAAAHPEFIKFLQNKGLSEWQIEYCCLYAIGLKGKDIGPYVNRKRHYNDSSEIRSKLGLDEHDTNLGNYLRSIIDRQQ